MHLDSKFAYAVMINANGVNPNKYVYGIHDLLKKVKPKNDELLEEDNINWSEYEGYYYWDIAEEVYISQWEGKLALLNLPSKSPADSMTLYKHIEGDTFRRIRSNEELGEKLLFERDQNGKIVNMKIHENYIYTKGK